MDNITLTDIIETLETLAGDLESDARADWATAPDKTRATIDAALTQQAVAIVRQLRERKVNNIGL